MNKIEKLENGAVKIDGVEYVKAEKAAQRKWEPLLGDPVFVWDDVSDETILVPLFYFYSKQPDGGCFTLSSLRCGERGAPWQHYRKYDPALVGVPRGDWPPEEAE